MDVRIQIEGRWFEWDSRKSDLNLTLPGRSLLPFSTVPPVFFDPKRLEMTGKRKGGEIRKAVIGKTANGAILTVIYTERKFNGKESIRIISARPAHTSERRFLQSQ